MAKNEHCKDGRNKLIKTIEADGWYPLKQKGSHLHFKHPEKRGKITIPYCITKNIELSVLRQAGLKQLKERRIK